MLRKILLTFVVLVLLAAGTLFALIATNSDIIIDKFNSYVENSTGAPLVSATSPEITLFPNRGLELGASSWKSPDGSLQFSFSRASVLLSSHDLFFGKVIIKNFSVDDLDVTVRLKKDIMEHLTQFPTGTERRRDLDELIQTILRTLKLCPDSVTISRGRICLVRPDGSTLVFSPFSLNATDVHPGADTDFKLHTEMEGSSPAFHAELDLRCSALFNEEKASFTIAQAMLTPGNGVAFREYLSLSGGLEYDFHRGSLSLSQLHFQGPDLSATASGSIASLARMYRDPRQGDATLKLELAGDPQRLGDILRRPLPFADHEIFSDCSLSAEMRWTGGQMRMTSIRGKADDLTFAGKLTASFSPLTLTGELKLGDLDLDAYRGDSRAAGAGKPVERNFARWPRVSLQLSAEHVRWNRLHLENVHTRLSGQSGSYEFNPLSGILMGSPVTASMKTLMLPTLPLSARISANFSLPQANLEELSRAAADQQLLSGTGALNASVSFTSSRGLPSLSGKGSLTSSQVQTAFSILPRNIPLAGSVNSTSRFDRLFFSFLIREGRLSIDRFSLDAPRLALSGTGELDLVKRTIDASGSIEMAGSSVLPVSLTGDLRAPQYSLEKRKPGASSGMQLNLKLPRQLEQIIGISR